LGKALTVNHIDCVEEGEIEELYARYEPLVADIEVHSFVDRYGMLLSALKTALNGIK